MRQISFRIWRGSPPALAISDGLVVAPSMMPSEASASISFTMPLSTKSFMACLPPSPRHVPQQITVFRRGFGAARPLFRRQARSASTRRDSPAPRPPRPPRAPCRRAAEAPMPDGVPVEMISPGSSVMTDEMKATSSGTGKMRSAVVESWRSTPLTQPRTRRFDQSRPRAMHGPDRGEGVEPLGPRVVSDRLLQCARRDVVHARHAEDVARRRGRPALGARGGR